LDTGPGSAWLGPFFRPGDHKGCLCTSVPLHAFPEPDGGVMGRRLTEAADSVHGRAANRVAAQDSQAGRVGTSLQNEVEIRDRITTDVAALKAHYIDGGAG
ncbi:MAG: hypothetical protein ACRDZY_08380, partial [Acidimicrobiales bacterium]